MPTKQDIIWFKQQFQEKVQASVDGTPFTVNMLTALACQETGEIWSILRKRPLSVDRILELCVGDTIDKKPNGGRQAFPQTKADLVAVEDGPEMFAIANKALLDMSQFIPGYKNVAANPNKFCHGYGIFQYDLQFFKEDPEYFLNKKYAKFEHTLAKSLKELKAALLRIGWETKSTLTDLEMAAVAIAYNTGRYRPHLGLKQGYKSGGKYYGELFYEYLRLAESVEVDTSIPAPIPVAGTAAVSAPTPVDATGNFYEVNVETDPLRLRKTPSKDPAKPTANVIASLPDGHKVRAVTGIEVNGYLEVETSLQGANLKGFAAAKYLKTVDHVNTIPVAVPNNQLPASGIVAVYMPRKTDSITKRTAIANAHSLNEPGKPSRTGRTENALIKELHAIIDWIDVDNPAHHRYQSRDGLTFCNIYAHDYCTLAGVYLPRVWWTQSAIKLLAQGQTVKPLYADTIDEIRANGLFRWFRDFGLEFGWRQTGTLTKLQQEVNRGAIGVIVARRKDDGRSGHIVMVVPESDQHQAKRNHAGDVIAPVQSQAGVNNFKYGNGNPNWWLGNQFAESAFWIHA